MSSISLKCSFMEKFFLVSFFTTCIGLQYKMFVQIKIIEQKLLSVSNSLDQLNQKIVSLETEITHLPLPSNSTLSDIGKDVAVLKYAAEHPINPSIIPDLSSTYVFYIFLGIAVAFFAYSYFNTNVSYDTTDILLKNMKTNTDAILKHSSDLATQNIEATVNVGVKISQNFEKIESCIDSLNQTNIIDDSCLFSNPNTPSNTVIHNASGNLNLCNTERVLDESISNSGLISNLFDMTGPFL